MGYRGRIADREQARELRAQAWTLQEIADAVGASRGQVSAWVRDVQFTPRPRSRARKRDPNKLERAKLEQIEQLKAEGIERIGRLSEREFLIAGLALYAGEGNKTGHEVRFANTDPRMILFFVTWLRRFFAPDERRLRIRLHLHEGLDLEAATEFWSGLAGIPPDQFGKPYRATVDSSLRSRKHPLGCPGVGICCSRTLRSVLGMIDALLSSACFPG